MKIGPMGAELFYAEEEMDTSRFSKFCEGV
jgi:hypothetical protein